MCTKINFEKAGFQSNIAIHSIVVIRRVFISSLFIFIFIHLFFVNCPVYKDPAKMPPSAK